MDILHSVRPFEKTVRKIARFRNHLRFSPHCKHHDVIPVSIRLNRTCQGAQASRILRRAERSLLNTRISDITRELSHLTAEEKRVRSILSDKLSSELMSKTEEIVKQAQFKEHEQCKQRHIKKFTNLIQKGKPTISEDNTTTDKWVKNVSYKNLTEAETSVLKKGVKFRSYSPDDTYGRLSDSYSDSV